MEFIKAKTILSKVNYIKIKSDHCPQDNGTILKKIRKNDKIKQNLIGGIV